MRNRDQITEKIIMAGLVKVSSRSELMKPSINRNILIYTVKGAG